MIEIIQVLLMILVVGAVLEIIRHEWRK